MGVLIELTVAPEDMGKIIGKEGRTAKAVRTLLRVFGAKNNSRINLKIVEPEGSERPERREPAVEAETQDDAGEKAESKSEEEVKEEAKEKKTEDVEDVPTDVLA